MERIVQSAALAQALGNFYQVCTTKMEIVVDAGSVNETFFTLSTSLPG